MTNQEKVLNLLGLAQKAGKLVSGEELSLQAIRKNRVTMLFIASDASENTRQKFIDKCTYYTVPFNIQFNHLELSSKIGRSRMIVAVCDEGFGRKMQKLLSS